MPKFGRDPISFWYPDYLAREREHKVCLRFIIGLSYIGVIAEAAYVVLNLVEGIPVFPTNLPLLGFLALLFTARFARSYKIVAHAFLAMFFVTIAGLCTYFRSFPFTILLWAPVFAHMSVFVAGKRGGCLWTVFLALFVGVLFFSLGPTPLGYAIQLEQVRMITFATLVLTMGSAFYSSVLFSSSISRLNKDLAEKNDKLSLQKQQVEEGFKEKQMLISLVCHDIANPLKAIAFAASTARERASDELHEVLDSVVRAADSISEIIADVSSMQAIELGKVKLEVKPVSLVKVIEKIKLLFADVLREKNLQLVFECAGLDDHLWVEAEEHSLTNSVLSNLVSNAIKFSEPNQTIVLQARLEHNTVKLFVKDFGVGMPESLLNDLFKDYKPTSRAGTRGERGTGFGLPITKVYMERYGGDISIFSSEKTSDGGGEHGTTCVLSFTKAEQLPS